MRFSAWIRPTLLRESAALVAVHGGTLLLCSGCFLVDDFQISENAPERLTTDSTTSPVDSETSGPEPSSHGSGIVDEEKVEPAKPILTAEPPKPSAEPTESSIPSSPPPNPTPSASDSIDNPVPSMTQEPSPVVDAGAPITEEPTPDAAVVGSDPDPDTTAMDPPDAAVEAGATPECESGWTYDDRQDWCSSDCAASEVQGPNGRCYWFGTQAVGFASARMTCTNHGTGWNAIAIRSEAEAEFIESQLVADTWIGATDQMMANTWRWIDDNSTFWQGDDTGMAVDGAYADWGSNEPSAANDEACARFHSGNGNWYWSDTACTDLFRAACQGPTPVEPTYGWGDNGGTGPGTGPGMGPGSGSR